MYLSWNKLTHYFNHHDLCLIRTTLMCSIYALPWQNHDVRRQRYKVNSQVQTTKCGIKKCSNITVTRFIELILLTRINKIRKARIWDSMLPSVWTQRGQTQHVHALVEFQVILQPCIIEWGFRIYSLFESDFGSLWSKFEPICPVHCCQIHSLWIFLKLINRR